MSENHQEKLEALREEYKEFLYIVAHDIHAPLRTIRAFTEIILNELSDNLTKEHQLYTDVINNSVEEAQMILDDLLVVSRIFEKECANEDLDLNEIVGTILEEKKAAHNIVYDIKKLPILLGDPEMIHKLFYELIDNAVKFVSEGSKPAIEIKSEPKGDLWHFQVTDKGIGIEPEYIETVFRIFKRLNPKELYEGRGLGLTLAKKIVEANHGNIWIESKLGEGTSVHFTLPRKK